MVAAYHEINPIYNLTLRWKFRVGVTWPCVELTDLSYKASQCHQKSPYAREGFSFRFLLIKWLMPPNLVESYKSDQAAASFSITLENR